MCSDWKEFSHHMINNGMFLVIAILAIKNIMLLIIGNQFFFIGYKVYDN
jgi:type IV secretory pathway VirB3-like protein